MSGHACQDELKQMIALTRPKFFIPVHGSTSTGKNTPGWPWEWVFRRRTS